MNRETVQPPYRLLKEGEEIRTTDEFQRENGDWVILGWVIGKLVWHEGNLPTRRKIVYKNPLPSGYDEEWFAEFELHKQKTVSEFRGLPVEMVVPKKYFEVVQ